MTTRAKRTAKSSGLEALVGRDRDALKQLVQAALGAGPGDRTANRLRYRARYPRPTVARTIIGVCAGGVNAQGSPAPSAASTPASTTCCGAPGTGSRTMAIRI